MGGNPVFSYVSGMLGSSLASPARPEWHQKLGDEFLYRILASLHLRLRQSLRKGEYLDSPANQICYTSF
jgi:hypothetical protein